MKYYPKIPYDLVVFFAPFSHFYPQQTISAQLQLEYTSAEVPCVAVFLAETDTKFPKDVKTSSQPYIVTVVIFNFKEQTDAFKSKFSSTGISGNVSSTSIL